MFLIHVRPFRRRSTCGDGLFHDSFVFAEPGGAAIVQQPRHHRQAGAVPSPPAVT